MNRTALFLAVLLLGAAPAGRAASETDALVAKVLEAYGGRAALAKVRAYRIEGAISSTMRGEGTFVRLFERPERLRVWLEYPGHPEYRILDGAKGWRSDGKGGMAPAEGFLHGSMVLQAGRANLPWLRDERRAELRLLPRGENGELRALEVPLGPGLALTAWVEEATGRITRSTAAIDVPGMRTGFVAEYAHFRLEDGVLFPFRETNAASGRTTGETVVSKVTLNPPTTGDDFRP